MEHCSQDLVVVQSVVGLGRHVDVDVLWLSVEVILRQAKLLVDIFFSVVAVVHFDLNKVDNFIIIEALIGWSVESRLGEVNFRLELEENDIVIRAIIGPAEWVSPSAEFWFHLCKILWVVPLSVQGRVIVKLAKICSNLPFNIALGLQEARSSWSSISRVHTFKSIWLLILKIELEVVWERIYWLWSIWVMLWDNRLWLDGSLKLLQLNQFSLG